MADSILTLEQKLRELYLQALEEKDTGKMLTLFQEIAQLSDQLDESKRRTAVKPRVA
jgi:hypothetical protein